MGDLVDFTAWKKRRKEEEEQRELAEIAELKEKLQAYMDELGEPETGPYYSHEE